MSNFFDKRLIKLANQITCEGGENNVYCLHFPDFTLEYERVMTFYYEYVIHFSFHVKGRKQSHDCMKRIQSKMAFQFYDELENEYKLLEEEERKRRESQRRADIKDIDTLVDNLLNA